jgi:hypothetical protein
LKQYIGSDKIILSICQSAAIEMIIKGRADDVILSSLSEIYRRGIVSGKFPFYKYTQRMHLSKEFPLETAIRIAKNADIYPSYLVAIAAQRCQTDFFKTIKPVLDVATEQRWFT